MSAPIDLAREPDFAMGPLDVYPSTHELGRGDRRTVIEPRVMQVLVALARAQGAVLTRDELTQRCWGGRIVGDDAIHRVLSRLRRLSEGIAEGVFRVETVTRVGYRLIHTAGDAEAPSVVEGESRPEASGWLDRRRTIGLAGTAAAVACGGLWLKYGAPASRPPEENTLIARARAALREGTVDQTAAAVSLLRQAVEVAPADAEAWGALALAYDEQAVRSGSAARTHIEHRCRAAAIRALELDPANADAAAAIATVRPFYRRWAAYETSCKRALEAHPDHGALNRNYGHFLNHVGRFRAASVHMRRANTADTLSPLIHWNRAIVLWCAGRLDEADAIIDRAIHLWPRHYAIWFVRVRILNFTGRAASARAMIEDRESRPVGIPEWSFALSFAEARALETGSPTDIDLALSLYMAASRRGSGYAENAFVFAAAVGRHDDAFRVAESYFFNRGFKLGEERFAEEQGMHNARHQRYTGFLFAPPTALLRTDRRFDSILREIGLPRYWAWAGTPPDYLA